MKLIFRNELYLVLWICLVLSGCGGGSVQSPPPPPPFISGLYQLFASSNSNAFTLSGSLMQSGATVSGVMHIGMPLCFSSAPDLPVNGTVSNDMNGPINLSLTLPSGQLLTFSLLHPGGHLPNLAGTFAITGPGCAAPEQGLANGGTVTLSGSWQGTLTSSAQTVSTINLNLTQSGPDAHGFFSAAGSGTITGGTCFSGVIVDPTTMIAGPGTHFVLNNNQSGTTGKLTIQGTILPGAFGGATFTGTYTSTQGACSEVGTASMQVG
jgi:hypothetical protein